MQIVKRLCAGLLFSYLAAGIFLLILALLLFKTGITGNMLRAGIIFSYIFPTILGGFIVGRNQKSRRFLWGLLLGVLFFLVIFAVSAAMQQTFLLKAGQIFSVFFMCALGGMLGGMLS